MPYKDRGKWRGVIVVNQKRVAQKSFRTKREAVEWERQTKSDYLKRTRMGSLIEIANDYLSCVQRKFTKTTYLDKKRELKNLVSSFGAEISILDITPIKIWDYLDGSEDRKKKGLNASPSKFNRSRKELMAFFNYAVKFHDLPTNPVAKIDPLPVNRTPQPVLTEEEFIKLMLAASRHDRNMLIVLGTTGARRSEIFRLTWTDDINFEKRTIRLGTRKSRDGSMKYRYCPMNNMAFESLQDQWKTKLPTSDYVFQNREKRHNNYGERFTTRRKFIRGLCKKTGIEKDSVGFHSIRRMFASLLADKYKKSIPTIQKLLGHSAPTTTDRYIYNISEDAKNAVENLDFGTSIPQAIPQNQKKGSADFS
ncbi:MAG: site-specific integrase [Deltaproteobacteria bacterium]|nr:site-specific integrase [Deltaproteobacteria bacterium]